MTAFVTSGQIAVTREILGWYFQTYFGKIEGPGCVPFYGDSGLVGDLRVDLSTLASGEPDALFRLAVLLAMYQSRRDQHIMAIQRNLTPSEVSLFSSPAAFLTAAGIGGCTHLRGLEALPRCDVLGVGSAVDCHTSPGITCPVKTAARAIRRMPDLGKMPASLGLLAQEGGSQGLAGLYLRALSLSADPRLRAIWLEEQFRRVWRIEKKIANFVLSALTHPTLTSGCHPWKRGIDWTWFVVVDTNVRRYMEAVEGPSGSNYEEQRRWIRRLAARIDLRHFHPEVHRFDPRLLQQALYRFMSRANREASEDDCLHRAPQSCQSCPILLAHTCPIRKNRRPEAPAGAVSRLERSLP